MRWSPRAAFLLPFCLSWILSLSTVGRTVMWQDSGFYLVAVHEVGILYPPGFVLYLLAARAWTLLLFLVDFTLAVHLFSSLCGATAAGVLGLAARELLRADGVLFRTGRAHPEPVATAVGAAAGCLAAAGYTFWQSAIMAKVYSFYYLALALVLFRMIRADRSLRPRDFTIAAALIGLCWQAHPSAALLGLGFLLFVVTHGRRLGWKGVAGRTLLAAGVALGPALLLPLLASLEPAGAFGDPRTPASLLEYLTGDRFLSRPGAFGWEPARFNSVGRFFWEEFLGVGLLLVAAGAVSLALRGRRFLGWVLAWSIPSLEVTVLFLHEGQHDHWFVAAWLPIHLVAAVGLAELASRAGRPAVATAAAALAGVAWAVGANYADLDQRTYRLGEIFARAHLDHLDPDAVLMVHSDDAAAGCLYLQEVRGVRRDVALVRPIHLEEGRTGRPGWHAFRLLRRFPDLAMPDFAAARDRFGREFGFGISAAAFVQANVDRRPIYMTFRLPVETLSKEHTLIPSGSLWKIVRKGREALTLSDWDYPVGPSEVRASFRRSRGQRDVEIDLQTRHLPEPYEWRLLDLLVGARANLAERHAEQEDWTAVAQLTASVLAADPKAEIAPEILVLDGRARRARGDVAGARQALQEAAERPTIAPAVRAEALAQLAELALERGDAAEGQRLFARAQAQLGLTAEQREALRRRSKQ